VGCLGSLERAWVDGLYGEVPDDILDLAGADVVPGLSWATGFLSSCFYAVSSKTPIFLNFS